MKAKLVFVQHRRTFVLDDVNERHGLCGGLGFSVKDHVENIRCIGEITKLFMVAGEVIVLTAFISPFRADCERVRGMVEHGDFIEIYCDSSIEVCESRDIKGHYQKARAGQISVFNGISSHYEAPEQPGIVVKAGVTHVLNDVTNRGFLQRVA